MSSKNQSKFETDRLKNKRSMEKRNEPTLVMTSKLPGNGLFAYGGTKSSFRSNTSYNSRTSDNSKITQKSKNGGKRIVKLPPMPGSSVKNMSRTVSEFGGSITNIGGTSSYNTNLSIVTNLTRDVEERVENKLLKILEKKVSELTKDLEREKAGKTQVEIEYKKLKYDYEEL